MNRAPTQVWSDLQRGRGQRRRLLCREGGGARAAPHDDTRPRRSPRPRRCAQLCVGAGGAVCRRCRCRAPVAIDEDRSECKKCYNSTPTTLGGRPPRAARAAGPAAARGPSRHAAPLSVLGYSTLGLRPRPLLPRPTSRLKPYSTLLSASGLHSYRARGAGDPTRTSPRAPRAYASHPASSSFISDGARIGAHCAHQTLAAPPMGRLVPNQVRLDAIRDWLWPWHSH